MYGFIYKTTCLINGKIYIGQTIRKRDSYLGSGRSLELSIKKYGKENFKREILCTCGNQKVLDLMEEHFIKKFNSTNKSIGYNILQGSSNLKTGVHPMEIPECKEKAVKEWKKTMNLKPLEEKQKSYRKQAETISKIQQNFSKEKKEEIKKKKSISIKLAYSNMSVEQKLDISKKLSKAATGKMWINNGSENKFIIKGDVIPDGWVAGRYYTDDQLKKMINKVSLSNKGNIPPIKGKRYITNGMENRLIFPEQPVPEGFRYGLSKFL